VIENGERPIANHANCPLEFVLVARFRPVAAPFGQDALPHHRQADEAERDGEVGPEPVVRLAGADHGEHQRRQDRAEIGDHPEHRPDSERHRRARYAYRRDLGHDSKRATYSS
jgi:hypothetical protein